MLILAPKSVHCLFLTGFFLPDVELPLLHLHEVFLCSQLVLHGATRSVYGFLGCFNTELGCLYLKVFARFLFLFDLGLFNLVFRSFVIGSRLVGFELGEFLWVSMFRLDCMADALSLGEHVGKIYTCCWRV